jgi:hypothetical protein
MKRWKSRWRALQGPSRRVSHYVTGGDDGAARKSDAEELGAIPTRRSDVHGLSRLASTATMRFDGRRELLKEKKRKDGKGAANLGVR